MIAMISKKLAGRRRRRRGANAVEFSLIAPVILAMTFGVMDYGWYFATYSIVQRAAQQGAQTGAQTALEDDPEASGILAAGDLIAANYPTNSMSVTYDSTLTDTTLVIDVEVQFDSLAGFVPTPSVIKCTSERLLEEQPDDDA